jgi:hypothetical protein
VQTERRKPPPLVATIKAVGFALAGAVGMWALSAGILDYETLKAVQAMKATPETVFMTDTIHDCARQDDHQTTWGGGPLPLLF